jgi:hypothetical protein
MITKRMVGLGLVLIGLVAIVGTISVDLIDAGKWAGVGPAQQLAIVVGGVIILLGLTLIPFGDRPA